MGDLENSPLVQLQTDPVFLTEVTYLLFEDRLNVESLDAFAAQVGPEEIAELREYLIEALQGFFPLLRTLSTQLQEILSGNIDLKEIVQSAEATRKNGEPVGYELSGTTS